jgi:predicted transposase YdaD
VELAGREVLRYDFHVVRLWELDPAPVLDGTLAGMLPLVPLMRGATPDQVPQLAERVVQLPDVSSLQRGDLLGILSVLGSLRFPKADMWSLLRRNTMLSELVDELIEDSPFLRQLHEEAVAEGEARGEARGHVIGLRASVRDIAQARFAEISADELAGVDTIEDASRLHALIVALASAPDVAAARRALAEAYGSPPHT